jgi:hypothetical protein
MLKLILTLAIIAGLAYCGATVKLGKKTFFGHVKAIWATEEVQDLKTGVEDKVGPTADKIKKGINAGVEAAENKDGSGSQAAPAPAQ